MKKLLGSIFVFFFFPLISYADCPSWTCGQNQCDISLMLSSPTSDCALQQWACNACLIEMQNHATDSEIRGRIRDALSVLPDRANERYTALWNQVGSNLKKSGQQVLSREVCSSIYESAQKSSCPVSSLEAVGDESLHWFNPYCLQTVVTYLNSHPAARKPELAWIAVARDPTFRFAMCCANSSFKDQVVCGNLLNSFVSYKGKIISILQERGYSFKTVRTSSDGTIREYTMSEEDEALRENYEEIMLEEVVVIGTGPNKSEETEQRVKDEFHYQGSPGYPDGKGNGGPGSDTPDKPGTITPEQCREWYNASQGVCDNTDSLLENSHDPAWLKPACIQELTELMDNENEMSKYKDRYFSELAVLGRLYSAKPWFNNYEKCNQFKNPSLRREMGPFLQKLKDKMAAYGDRCITLQNYSKQNSCPEEASALLSSSLNSNNWENPQCIKSIADFVDNMQDITLLRSPSVLAKMQKAIFLSDEYKACMQATPVDKDTTFRQASDTLYQALLKRGAVDGSFRPGCFGEDECSDASVSSSKKNGSEGGSSATGADGEGTSGDGSKGGSPAGTGAPGEARGIDGGSASSPFLRWDDRAGGLFAFRFLQPYRVGSVDTFPEQNQ